MLCTLSLTCCGLWELVLQPILATYHWSSLVIARKGNVILRKITGSISKTEKHLRFSWTATANNCNAAPSQRSHCHSHWGRSPDRWCSRIADRVQTKSMPNRSQANVFEILGCPPQTLKIELSRSSVLCLWLRPQGSKNHSHAIVAAILAMPKLTCPRKLQYTQNSTTSGCGPQRRGCEWFRWQPFETVDPWQPRPKGFTLFDTTGCCSGFETRRATDIAWQMWNGPVLFFFHDLFSGMTFSSRNRSSKRRAS